MGNPMEDHMQMHALRRALAPRLASAAPAAAPSNTTSAAIASGTVAQPASAPAETNTNNLCQTQLQKLNGNPSNPSGKSACYNVAALNTQTGAFQTEVWIYNIGLPTGLWANLLASEEIISLTYPGGQVDGKGQDLALPPAGGSPSLNASLLFTGQLSAASMSMLNNETAMRMALMPQILIKAETSDGEFLSINMSNQEAAFINGVYSDPAFTASQAQAFAATGTPFVLPGTTFGVFPTGLIVSMAWTGLLFAAVGGGTVGRYRFRMAYRRRSGHIPTTNANGEYTTKPGTAAYDRR